MNVQLTDLTGNIIISTTVKLEVLFTLHSSYSVDLQYYITNKELFGILVTRLLLIVHKKYDNFRCARMCADIFTIHVT